MNTSGNTSAQYRKPGDPEGGRMSNLNASDNAAEAGPSTAQERAEAMSPIADSSATAYIDGIVNGGVPRSEISAHRAFVDGFMTAIELLLTAGEQK